MKIVTTFHHPSSVLSSLKCQLSSRDREHLVVLKLNKVEVYTLHPEGLTKPQCEVELWGKALSIKSIPIAASSRSNLVLLLTHPDPELIFFNYTETEGAPPALNVQKQLSLYERTPRPAEFFNDVLVHPSGKLAVVSCYVGKLKVVTLKAGHYEGDFDVLLPELNVFGLTFLPLPDDESVLGILHRDYQGRVQLLARDLVEVELSSQPSTMLQPTSISAKVLPFPTDAVPKLISVPPPPDFSWGDDESFQGGVLIVGGRRILLYQLSNSAGRQKQSGKQRRLESKLKSSDSAEVSKAQQKEKEREARIRKATASVEWPWGEVTAICCIDRFVPRFIIGDRFGKLSMLSVDQISLHGLVLIPLGETSPATTLTYLSNQKLFLGSHLGDSQLLHISQTPVSSSTTPTLLVPPDIKTSPPSILSERGGSDKGKGKASALGDGEARDISKGTIIQTTGSFVDVVDTFKNIAPIMDAVLVDVDESGDKQIVTCSGGGNTGSINIVRSGADFQELASITRLTNVTSVWGLRDQYEDEIDSHVLVSTLHSTRLYKINDAGRDTTLSEVKADFITDLPTLAAGNVMRRASVAQKKVEYRNSRLVVQVTHQGVYLLMHDPVLGSFVKRVKEWRPENGHEIVAADVNPSQILLATAAGRLVALTLNVDDDELKMVVQGNPPGGPISAVSCKPLDPTKFYSLYVTVAYWKSNLVEIFLINDSGFSSISKLPMSLPALVRSVLLHSFGSDHSSKGADYHPYLFAGLGDGTVACIPWKDKQLKERKILSLGHAPVSLTVSEVKQKRAVSAAGSRAAVFSWGKNRLHVSPVMLKDVVFISRLNTKSFRFALIMGYNSGLSIGRIGELDKMHIRTIPFGLDNPRKIAYQPSLKVFGVACTRTEPARIGDPELIRSSFRILDDVTFSTMSNFNCDFDEEIASLTSFSPVIGAKGKQIPLFCVGTYTYKAGETEPSKGRIILLAAHSSTGVPDLQLSLITFVQVKGCVYALTVVNDMIVAAVNSSIMLCRVNPSGPSEEAPAASLNLQLLFEWNHNYIVTSLASYGSRIVAGDQISSVSLLQIVDSELQSVARDFGPLWPVCVEANNDKSLISANDSLNLFSFTLNNQMGRPVLERDGTFHLADFVTKFIRGSIATTDTTDKSIPLHPSHVFVTSSGRIGVLVDVADIQLSLHLTELQRNLVNVVPTVGGVSHTRFRAPRNARGRSDADQAAFGFLDGDFIEQFLTFLTFPEKLDKIIEGNSEPERLTISTQDLQRILESLRSMH